LPAIIGDPKHVPLREAVAYVAQRIAEHPLVSLLGNEKTALWAILDAAQHGEILLEGMPDRGGGVVPEYQLI
jgi:hypothetical protein